MTYLFVKWLHILSSTVLFGTGLGSAFSLFFASRTRNTQAMAVVTRQVVMADWIFTTPTIVLQPLTGFYLLHLTGLPFTTPWVMWSFGLYLLAGAAWLPVVWMQIRMRDMASVAAEFNQLLDPRYWQFLKLWVALGVVAFGALVIVFYLMVAKPSP